VLVPVSAHGSASLRLIGDSLLYVVELAALRRRLHRFGIFHQTLDELAKPPLLVFRCNHIVAAIGFSAGQRHQIADESGDSLIRAKISLIAQFNSL
jgi:hypothetical protein